MEEKGKVFCIIVTYNAMKWIDKCLTKLQESSLVPAIVVIDNCSKDESVSFIKNKYPQVHIIENKKNRGFGGANNQGIEYAYLNGAEHFFLLNQDAYVHTNTIDKLVDIQRRTGAELVSPIHLNGNGDLMDCEFFKTFFGGENNNQICADLIKGCTKEYYSTTTLINAAAWMLSRKAIEEIGGFDPIFFHYGEDCNYLQRLHYHKRLPLVVPGCYVNHDRKEHGNMKMYNKQTGTRALLMVYLDINKHHLIYYVTRHLKDIAKFFIFLFTLNLKKSYYLLRAYFLFFINWPKYRNSRKENRLLQPNWLQI